MDRKNLEIKPTTEIVKEGKLLKRSLEIKILKTFFSE